MFTVSELNQFIKDVLNAGFPQPVWVCGEIQQYDRNKTKKHIFFELVEKDPQSHEIKARIGLVIFGGQKALIDDILRRSENAFELKDDIEVKFACRVDFYPPHGAVRLIVESIDPVYTLGKVAQSRQKLIALLQEKGVFEKNKSVEFPLVPLKVGLVTAYDSAAYHDFISELQRSGLRFEIYNRNTQMQGKKAEKDVCQALKELSKMEGLDVIVITRGGGSIADLSCFDSQMIAEAVAACPLPVLSAIGHEINTTITDLTAHTFVKTPTAIANFLVLRIQEYLTTMDEKGHDIFELTQTKIKEHKGRLKDDALNLDNHIRHFLKFHHEKLVHFLEVLKHQPKVLLKECLRVSKEKRNDLTRSVKLRFDNASTQLNNYATMIAMVHPAKTMRRGFSIARRKDGKVVKSIKDISLQDQLRVEVFDGHVDTQVNNIKGG